jgi:hypothetical protein
MALAGGEDRGVGGTAGQKKHTQNIFSWLTFSWRWRNCWPGLRGAKAPGGGSNPSRTPPPSLPHASACLMGGATRQERLEAAGGLASPSQRQSRSPRHPGFSQGAQGADTDVIADAAWRHRTNFEPDPGRDVALTLHSLESEQVQNKETASQGTPQPAECVFQSPLRSAEELEVHPNAPRLDAASATSRAHSE